MCLIFKRSNTAAITDDMKLEPWSLSISSGIPNLEKNLAQCLCYCPGVNLLERYGFWVTSCEIHEC